MNGVDSWPAPPDEMLMMLPPPAARMWGTTARHATYRLRTFTRIDSSHSSAVDAANVARVGAIALFTSTSMRPNRSAVVPISDSMSSATPMSHRTASAVPPAGLDRVDGLADRAREPFR